MFTCHRPLSSSFHAIQAQRTPTGRAVSSHSTSIPSENNSLKSSHVTVHQAPSRSLDNQKFTIKVRCLSSHKNNSSSFNQNYSSIICGPVSISRQNFHQNQKKQVCKTQMKFPKFIMQRKAAKAKHKLSSKKLQFISEMPLIPQIQLQKTKCLQNYSQISREHQNVYENPENQIQISFRANCSVFTRNKSQPGIFICDFKIIKFLRQRKLGQQFLAVNRQTAFLVVIRRIKKQDLKNKKKDQLLLQEIRNSFRLNNSFTRKIYGFFDDEKHFYCILECTQQITLCQKLQINGRMEQSRIIQIVILINEGLISLHKQGYYNGQLKTSNILCNYDEIKMIGIEGFFKDKQNIRKSASKQFDMWCLGIIVYELLVGRLFNHQSQEDIEFIRNPNQQASKLRTINDKSHALKHLLLSLLNPSQKQRISSEQVANLPFIKAIKLTQQQDY